MYTCIYIHDMYRCTNVYLHVPIHTHMCMCMQAGSQAHVHMSTCMHVYECVGAGVPTYVYTKHIC